MSVDTLTNVNKWHLIVKCYRIYIAYIAFSMQTSDAWSFLVQYKNTSVYKQIYKLLVDICFSIYLFIMYSKHTFTINWVSFLTHSFLPVSSITKTAYI